MTMKRAVLSGYLSPSSYLRCSCSFAVAALCVSLTGCAVAAPPDTHTEPIQKAPQPVLSIEKETIQYGGRRLDLLVNGRPAFLFLPAKKSADKPLRWVWYVFFDGYAPGERQSWLIQGIMNAGLAFGGINVGESYGSPAGIQADEEFFEAVTSKFGLAPKVVLLPQSRGGLQFYNWATNHPASVERIAGIYPVSDLRSYPGLEKAAPAYGLSAGQLQEELAAHNPIDLLEPLAKARIPILHLHGDQDTVVPLEPNSGEVARRYRALGGDFTLLVVPGKGHEEANEFFESQPLLDFIIGQPTPSATKR